MAGETVTAVPVARDDASAAPTVEVPLTSALPAKLARLDSVDILRGIVMVIMALDHVRDYFTYVRFDPTDLTQASAALFLTRWITHFCAPVFVFLAGTGAFLSASRGKPLKELSRFLWTRGLMLVLFEVTIVRFGWLFNFSTNVLFVQVIWAIGVSMICLAGLVRLSKGAIATIAIVMIVGHNALDGVSPAAFGPFEIVWRILHVSEAIPLSSDTMFLPFYPLIPWIGVMAAGYVFGSIMLFESGRRRRTLLRLGLGLTVAFIIIRALNVYGDPHLWTSQKDALFTFFSFINTTKYPPSLDYLLMTLGPSIFLLGLIDRGMGRPGKFFVVYGRVPMFYYIVHIYFVHALAVIAGAAQGYGFSQFFDVFLGFPATYGFGLPVIYLIWVGVNLCLYPACRWFGELKRRRKDVWLSYL
jgi:uncharacterized membrane protein